MLTRAVCACVCRALEEAVYDEANHEEECSREHVARALLRIDLDMSDKVAQQVSTAQCAAAGCWQRGEARGGLPARLCRPPYAAVWAALGGLWPSAAVSLILFQQGLGKKPLAGRFTN